MNNFLESKSNAKEFFNEAYTGDIISKDEFVNLLKQTDIHDINVTYMMNNNDTYITIRDNPVKATIMSDSIHIKFNKLIVHINFKDIKKYRIYMSDFILEMADNSTISISKGYK